MTRKIDLERLHGLMERDNLDVLIASSPENVFYISDLPTTFTSSNRLFYSIASTTPTFCVIPKGEEPKLIITNSAAETARKHSLIKDQRTYATGVYIVREKKAAIQDYRKGSLEALTTMLDETRPIEKIGVEQRSIQLALFNHLKGSFADAALVGADSVFDEMRMVKTEEEIKRFAMATKIACKAILKVVDSVEAGISELELDKILKTAILDEGGDSWHQTTIAVGAENGPDIFNQPSQKKVTQGDIIRIDIGPTYKGYTADISRVVVFDKLPEKARRLYKILMQAEEKAIEAIKPGVTTSYVHKIGQEYVRDRYDTKYTRGNIGHGVGISLWEPPILREKNPIELAVDMTMSVEIPYHKFGLGGFNIEDSVIVTKNDHEIISDISREIFIV